jgi:hypothetical protein
MNPCSQHLYLDFAKDRMNQRRAEADRYRIARVGRAEKPALVERLARAGGQAVGSVRQSFRVDRRPSLPMVLVQPR